MDACLAHRRATSSRKPSPLGRSSLLQSLPSSSSGCAARPSSATMDAFTSPGRSSAEACERENFEAQDGVWGVPAVRMVWGSGVHVCSCLARGVSLDSQSAVLLLHTLLWPLRRTQKRPAANNRRPPRVSPHPITHSHPRPTMHVLVAALLLCAALRGSGLVACALLTLFPPYHSVLW